MAEIKSSIEVGTFTDDNEWRPNRGMRVTSTPRNDARHGPSQRFGTTNRRRFSQFVEGPGYQAHCGIGVDSPMRDEKRSGTCIEE